MKELKEIIHTFLKNKNIKQLIVSLYGNAVVKYIFFGVLSTLVNFGIFYVLHKMIGWEVFPANLTSISCAVLFAYVVNARFVFESKTTGFIPILQEMGKFIGARLSTLLLELFGVSFLVDTLHSDATISKIGINVIVLIANYVFSAFIFKKR
ncbi:GtrA family protein [Carnobacteriaceae bacterium zg-ZUI252]|nr:GtrA family protein [Carnobacteriaceae bacterium zg-ZUI252]